MYYRSRKKRRYVAAQLFSITQLQISMMNVNKLESTSMFESSEKAVMRIFITGLSGSGKTTLANRIAAKTELPVIHLDDVQMSFPEEGYASAVLAAMQAPEWIIEGLPGKMAGPICERATLVLLLDISPMRCRFRIAKRVISRFLSGTGNLSDAKRHPPIRLSNIPSFVKYLKSIRLHGDFSGLPVYKTVIFQTSKHLREFLLQKRWY